MTHVTLHAHEARTLAQDGSLMWVRPVKPQPIDNGNISWEIFVDDRDGGWEYLDSNGEGIGIAFCPLTPGTEVWGRETTYRWTGIGSPPTGFVRDRCYADHPEWSSLWRSATLVTVPPPLMPRWATRFPCLLVGEVRCVRVGELGSYANHRDIRRMGFGDAYKAPEQLHNYLVTWWQSRYAKAAPWPSAWVWAVELIAQPDSPAEEG